MNYPCRLRQYNIALPSGLITAELSLEDAETEGEGPINLLGQVLDGNGKRSGVIQKDPGVYLLKLKLATAYQSITRADKVHIYSSTRHGRN
jgi:hypothetical protein